MGIINVSKFFSYFNLLSVSTASNLTQPIVDDLLSFNIKMESVVSVSSMKHQVELFGVCGPTILCKPFMQSTMIDVKNSDYFI